MIHASGTKCAGNTLAWQGGWGGQGERRGRARARIVQPIDVHSVQQLITVTTGKEKNARVCTFSQIDTIMAKRRESTKPDVT